MRVNKGNRLVKNSFLCFYDLCTNEVVRDLKKCGLDSGLAKDRERWKAQVIGKTFDLYEHGHSVMGRKTRRERERNKKQS